MITWEVFQSLSKNVYDRTTKMQPFTEYILLNLIKGPMQLFLFPQTLSRI